MAMSSQRVFGHFFMPALKRLNAPGLSVVRANGESAPAQIPPQGKRIILRPLRFKLL